MTTTHRHRAALRGGLLPAVLLALALSGCSTDPVPLGTPQPPAALTTPTPVPTTAAPAAPATPVPSVPIQDSSLAAQAAAAAANQPVPPTHITIDQVSIDMPVLAMGVDASGAMDLPVDTADAGWYEFSSTPTDPEGTTVVAAHVDSLEYGLGAFVRLRDIQVGASVALTTADGSVHKYTVAQVVRTPKTDVPLGELFDTGGAPRLVMVTCGGVFNKDTGHYLDNVIVTATPDAS